MSGSRDAFDERAASRRRASAVLAEQDSNARSPERPRMSKEAVAAIHTQCANAETSLEVDHMMLDYLGYQAICACLASRDPSARGTSHMSLAKSMALADTFLAMFKDRHPSYAPDAELRFRIELLKFTALFTQRLTRNPSTPSSDQLQELRNANKLRPIQRREPAKQQSVANAWKEQSIPQDDLERNRAHMLHELGVPPEDEKNEDAHYGTMRCVSLLDILPQFMQISAAIYAMSGFNLTESWMRMAGEFMLQACLEQQLVFGKTDVLDEAFSWGYVEGAATPDNEAGFDHTDGSTAEINAMFEDEKYAVEVEGWNDIKSSYLRMLLLPPSNDPAEDISDMIRLLETIAAKHPIAAFEASLHRFLSDMSKSIPEPVLTQLEKGKLDGMTEEETQDFLRDCGAGVAQFFEAPAGFKPAIG